MDGLKPCPFCGGPALSFSEQDGVSWTGQNEYRAFAGCGSCAVGFDLAYVGDDLCADGEEEGCAELERRARAIWNGRASLECRNVYDGREFECSNCGMQWHLLDRCDVYDEWAHVRTPRFCPGCGAKVANVGEA